jgi:5'-deoxynucleotidase YfbR-like HD superfamily hydrolase
MFETHLDQARVDEIVNLALRVGGLAIDLGGVDRATPGPHGRRESDTDHTVSLAFVAVTLAYYYGLDPGKAALLALSHDTPEAITGDIKTHYPDEQLLQAKRKLDAEGEAELDSRFGDTAARWLLANIAEYERGNSPEAALNRLLDKKMRAVAHIRDGCNMLRADGMTVEEHDRNVAMTYKRMAKDMEAFPEVAAAWRALDDRVRAMLAVPPDAESASEAEMPPKTPR